MTQRCQFCDRPIQWPEDRSVCLGDHPDRERCPMVLHIHCPCPVHYFEADRQYFSHRSEANSSDDASTDGATIDELLDEVIDEHPDLADDDE